MGERSPFGGEDGHEEGIDVAAVEEAVLQGGGSGQEKFDSGNLLDNEGLPVLDSGNVGIRRSVPLERNVITQRGPRGPHAIKGKACVAISRNACC